MCLGLLTLLSHCLYFLSSVCLLCFVHFSWLPLCILKSTVFSSAFITMHVYPSSVFPTLILACLWTFFISELDRSNKQNITFSSEWDPFATKGAFCVCLLCLPSQSASRPQFQAFWQIILFSPEGYTINVFQHNQAFFAIAGSTKFKTQLDMMGIMTAVINFLS